MWPCRRKRNRDTATQSYYNRKQRVSMLANEVMFGFLGAFCADVSEAHHSVEPSAIIISAAQPAVHEQCWSHSDP